MISLIQLDLFSNIPDDLPLPDQIAQRYNFPLAYHDIDDKRYYAVQDWIVGVAQTDNPRAFLSEMKKRFKKNGIQLSTWCSQLPYTARNGKRYQMDHADAETLYKITQRMDTNTGLRDDILEFLAKAGVFVDEIRRDPGIAIDMAHTLYKRQGKSDKWIEQRTEGKVNRHRFTDALKDTVIEALTSQHYQQATDDVNMGLWGRTAAKLRNELSVPKRQNLRDHLPHLALMYLSITEETIAQMLEDRQTLSWTEAENIVVAVSDAIGKQAKQTGAMLGQDIATGRKLLR